MESVQRCKPLLGTFVEITLTAEQEADTLMYFSQLALEKIEYVQSALSFHDEQSELSKFNRWAMSPKPEGFIASPEFTQVLSLALSLYHESNGYFDIGVAPHLIQQSLLPAHLGRLPENLGNASHIHLDHNTITLSTPVCIDLGGIAKGFALDMALACVPGEITASINAGGDVRFNHWENQNVAIKYAKRGNAQKRSPMLDAALATSNHYHHKNKSAIVCPIAQKPIKRKGSISVFASSAMLADALTKLVWLMEKSDYQPLMEKYKAKILWINRFGHARQQLF